MHMLTIYHAESRRCHVHKIYLGSIVGQLRVCLFSLAFAPVTQGDQSSCFMTLMLSALKSHPYC